MSSQAGQVFQESRWAERQRAFAERMGTRAVSDLESGTIVVVPSITFPVAELAKITAAQFYEERLLFLTLLLGRPGLRMVYVTSVPVDPAVIDYYLGYTADPAGARERLALVSLDDAVPRPLSEKLLGRPDGLAAIAQKAGDPDDACVVTFNVNPAELAACQALGLPLYGPTPDVAARLGSKSGARRLARRAGVDVLEGAEDLFSVDALDAAVAAIRSRRPTADAVVVKLNNGFSGQGSAMVDLGCEASRPLGLMSAPTTFCAAEESWPSFAAKVAAEGAIVEEMLSRPGTVSPSVQLHVSPAGSFEVVSTHDQVLGAPGQQVYVGCRFPADASYRRLITEAAEKVAELAAAERVVGSFGIDFLVSPEEKRVWLSEINLRMGGTTHPFWMARLATDGTYDAATGNLVAGGVAKAYVATDNFKSPSLVGRTTASVIDSVADAGLAFDPATATGTTLHLLGAVPGYGKMGATCIGDSPEQAEELYRRVAALLVG
ncbi:MAG: peptide ligase PGM1-related protein [Acidimicrobiales bacterium]